jgi:Domain of unknown function (DUF4118)
MALLDSHSLRPLSSCAVAVAAVGGAALATFELGSILKHEPTIFLCSVLFSSWFGGVWFGILASLLSAVALDYYFIPPLYAFGVSLEEAPDMVVFLASAFFVSWLAGQQKPGKDSLMPAHPKLDTKVRESTGELGPPQGLWRPEMVGREGVEKGSIQEHAEVPRGASVASIGGPLTAIVPEPNERMGEVQELVPECHSHTRGPEKMDAVLSDGAVSEPLPSSLGPRKESVFLREGDYWTIHYQGEVTRLKATRGLRCLASLLGHPGQEFHVSELIAAVAEVPVATVGNLASGTGKEDGSAMRTGRLQDAGPILDARAKAEYALRLTELREELVEAERFNDTERSARTQQDYGLHCRSIGDKRWSRRKESQSRVAS